MIPIDSQYNIKVRQQFAMNCLSLKQKIIDLQASNEPLSRKLLAAIEKGQTVRERWLTSLDRHYSE